MSLASLLIQLGASVVFSGILYVAYKSRLGQIEHSPQNNDNNPRNNTRPRRRKTASNRRNISPILPKMTSCEKCPDTKPDEPCCYICSSCGSQFCATCSSVESCADCGSRGFFQQFEPKCTFCSNEIIDCFLRTCGHMYHKDCLMLWIENSRSPDSQCIYCRTLFMLSDISNDFRTN